jgi:hypothetical protein
VAASTATVPVPLDSRTIPVPQLLATTSNGSQRLNCSCLTNSLTHQPTLHFPELHCTALPLTNCPGYNISARTAQKTPFLVFVVQSLSWEHVCLRSRFLAMAVVYLLIPRSLPSSGRCLWSHYVATGLHVAIYITVSNATFILSLTHLNLQRMFRPYTDIIRYMSVMLKLFPYMLYFVSHVYTRCYLKLFVSRNN